MILWIAFAILAAAVIAALARPMLADRAAPEAEDEADLAVYRDQMAEIEADLERGLITRSEAKSARAELGRRMIVRADGQSGKANAAKTWIPSASPTHIAYATAAIVPVLTLAIYLGVGSPWLPGMPLTARMHSDPTKSSVNELIAKVEAQLRNTPEDGVGWDVLAPVYLRQRRYDDAANAFGQALRLLGETPKRLRGFGEATVMANNGIVTEPARKAFERIVELDKDQPNPEARFWIALSDEQEGKIAEARLGYENLLKEAPEGAPWKAVVENRLNNLDGNAKRPSIADQAGTKAAEAPSPATPSERTPQAAPGPSAADVAAAGQMSQSDRQDFINSMVERLADKLQKNPEDFEGWLRLVRAYSVLGRTADAQRALEDAKKSVGEDSDKMSRLETLASELGLKSS